jgi:hypothetical protein
MVAAVDLTPRALKVSKFIRRFVCSPNTCLNHGLLNVAAVCGSGLYPDVIRSGLNFTFVVFVCWFRVSCL